MQKFKAWEEALERCISCATGREEMMLVCGLFKMSEITPPPQPRPSELSRLGRAGRSSQLTAFKIHNEPLPGFA